MTERLTPEQAQPFTPEQEARIREIVAAAIEEREAMIASATRAFQKRIMGWPEGSGFSSNRPAESDDLERGSIL